MVSSLPRVLGQAQVRPQRQPLTVAGVVLVDLRSFEVWIALVIAEIVARPDPKEKNDGRQRDHAGECEERYPADSLGQYSSPGGHHGAANRSQRGQQRV